ncbi:MAG TPA: hypothetical protein DCY13_00845 [Verrucomicrobiales bacterium]|nr:hypothetical protein [Verrucomicrobiales bacterium]
MGRSPWAAASTDVPSSIQIAEPVVFSLADQSFSRTKSVGILNVSLGLGRALLDMRPGGGMTLLVNGELSDRFPDSVNVRKIQCEGAARSPLGRIWYDQVGVYRAARRFPGAWLVLPKGYASFILPPPRGVRLACYVHDAMQLHYRRHHPGYFPRFERVYFWRGFLSTLCHADLIMTNSHFTAGELKEFAAARSIRLAPVVPVGIGFDAPPAPKAGAARSGFLVLASRMPHKLTSLAVEWLGRWQREQPGFAEPVSWVGSLPRGIALPEFPNWRLINRLDDAQYHELMNRARALVYFSEYEGFGMPPVEAVFRGAAPVYSDIPATREVMTGRGMPFDNHSYTSFSEALLQGLECGSKTLDEWARSLVDALRWPDVAGRAAAAMNRISCG